MRNISNGEDQSNGTHQNGINDKFLPPSVMRAFTEQSNAEHRKKGLNSQEESDKHAYALGYFMLLLSYNNVLP